MVTLALPRMPPISGRLGTIPDGVDGVRATLRIMVRLANEGKTVVRPVALQLTQHLPQRDYPGEVDALFDFVKNNIRYVQDIRNIETLQTPAATLQLKAGDCDDKSVLLAALLESIGHPARFHVIGFRPGHFQHVYVETKIGGGWVALETTEDWDAGRAAPAVSHLIANL